MPLQDMHVDTNLVRIRKRLLGESAGKRLLYIGFGEGQNLRYLAEEGFLCFGTEMSLGRVRHARAQFKKAGQRAVLCAVDSHKLPFPDNYFDIVIAWQSLYYNDRAGLIRSLQEVRRVLASGGIFISSMLSVKHTLCGKEIAPSVFRPANVPPQRKCTLYCFKTKKDIQALYRNFTEIQIGFYAQSLFKSFDYHYVIFCKKRKTASDG